MKGLSRRKFLLTSGAALAGSAVSGKLQAKSYLSDVFVIADSNQDIPTSPHENSVTISTGVLPESESPVKLGWQIATDEFFEEIVNEDECVLIKADRFTVKIELHKVPKGSTLYYRFNYEGCELIAPEASDSVVRYDVYPTREIKTSLKNYRSDKQTTILV